LLYTICVFVIYPSRKIVDFSLESWNYQPQPDSSKANNSQNQKVITAHSDVFGNDGDIARHAYQRLLGFEKYRLALCMYRQSIAMPSDKVVDRTCRWRTRIAR